MAAVEMTAPLPPYANYCYKGGVAYEVSKETSLSTYRSSIDEWNPRLTNNYIS